MITVTATHADGDFKLSLSPPGDAIPDGLSPEDFEAAVKKAAYGAIVDANTVRGQKYENGVNRMDITRDYLVDLGWDVHYFDFDLKMEI